MRLQLPGKGYNEGDNSMAFLFPAFVFRMSVPLGVSA